MNLSVFNHVKGLREDFDVSGDLIILYQDFLVAGVYFSVCR